MFPHKTIIKNLTMTFDIIFRCKTKFIMRTMDFRQTGGN